MPNWVFNTYNGYTKDIFNKYKSEERDIDFNKIIPEPEELTDVPCSGFNKPARLISEFRKYTEDSEIFNANISRHKFDYKNPLINELENIAASTSRDMGDLVIENPDIPLSNLLEEENHKWEKRTYEEYVSIYGNKAYKNIRTNEEFDQVCENYCNVFGERFKNSASDSYKKFGSIKDFGDKLAEYKEKYGYDNWYDWRLANWGVKWNASESSYDEECESLHFDTPWAIPYPIAAKIAQDNPKANIDCYSEVEQGWFDESEMNDGKVSITASGEYEWEETANDKDGCVYEAKEIKEPKNPPITFNYDDIINNKIMI